MTAPAASIAVDLLQVVDSAAERLCTLQDPEVSHPRAPGKWSPKEILGHLIDSASNNHHRFVRAQEVDALTFPKYAQEHWVRVQGYHESSWPELVELWRLYNRHLAQVIGRIPPERLDTVCTITPNAPVTLGFLVEDYLEHLKHHLRQILGS
jgi:hypothetical protein